MNLPGIGDTIWWDQKWPFNKGDSRFEVTVGAGVTVTYNCVKFKVVCIRSSQVTVSYVKKYPKTVLMMSINSYSFKKCVQHREIFNYNTSGIFVYPQFMY